VRKAPRKSRDVARIVRAKRHHGNILLEFEGKSGKRTVDGGMQADC
jgi:hypothetical protein